MVKDGLNRELMLCLSAISLLILSRMQRAMAVPSIFSATMIVEEKVRAWGRRYEIPLRLIDAATAAEKKDLGPTP